MLETFLFHFDLIFFQLVRLPMNYDLFFLEVWFDERQASKMKKMIPEILDEMKALLLPEFDIRECLKSFIFVIIMKVFLIHILIENALFSPFARLWYTIITYELFDMLLLTLHIFSTNLNLIRNEVIFSNLKFSTYYFH